MSNLQSRGDEWRYANKEKRLYSPRYFLVLLILVLSALTLLVLKESPATIRLGLDLRGGTTIVLQPQQTEVGKITSESIAQALEILRQRVDGVGVSESEIRAEGNGASTKIIVAVPGTTERELVNLVGQTAKLSIRPVLFVGNNSGTEEPSFPDYITKEMRASYLAWSCPKEVTSTSDDIANFLIACDHVGATKYILGPSRVEGSQINDAQFALDQGSLGWVTNLSFNAKGRINFGELSTAISALPSPRNQMAIVLDGKIVVAPRVDGPLTGGQVRIYGGFTQEYAKELSNVLKYGALPFSFRIDEVQQISATLGGSQLKSGLTAGALGLILISLYLLFYYRSLGILATASLVMAFLITFLLFILLGRWIGLTLTLAGIAGAIVSIGVTADSFIVYFERIRDQMREGASLRIALERGWSKAKRTVWIADSVSLIAASTLYLFTTGNVRGFAFTLGITTLIDLFIIYFFTRPTLNLLQKFSFFSKGHRYSGLSQSSLGIISDINKIKLFDLNALGGRLFRGEADMKVVYNPKRWFIISGTSMIAAAISLSVFGLNLGLEFKGGSVNVVTSNNPSTDQARVALNQIGYNGQAIIQKIGENKISVTTSQLSSEDATKLAIELSKVYSVDVSTIDSQNVGPYWGAEISHKALLGLFWFIVILLIYLTFALEIRMAITAIIAVIHDVFITVGLYAASGLKVTPAAVIGFLTVLGYSLYDTVVVFDKVRENVKNIKNRSIDEYRKAVNLALNQTLIRSINTSIVAVIPIASILIVGAVFLKADTLKDISLALVIGQTIGTYSSIFIAAPLLVTLNSKRKQTVSITNSVNLLVQPQIPSRIPINRQNLNIELKLWELAPIKQSDSAELFQILHSKPEVWETLWTTVAPPQTLEDFSALIQEQESKVNTMSSLYVVRSIQHRKAIALVVLLIDTVNRSADLKLQAILINDTNHFEDFMHELHLYLLERGIERFALHIHNIQSEVEFVDSLSVIQEARIPNAYKLRDGLCDAIIYRYLEESTEITN